MNELELPPTPPLPPEVRERALRTVLGGMGGAAERRSRRAPVAAAAAAVLVAIAATIAATLSSGGGSVEPGPLLPPPVGTPDTTRAPTIAPTVEPVEPLPDAELPAPSGDPATDAALARCAAAVVRSGHSAEYPPTAQWRSTNHVGTRAVESELTIDDSFACLVTPGSVAVSGRGTDAPTGVQVVRMSPGLLVVLNPQGRRFTIGSGSKAWSDTARVTFLPVHSLQVDDVPLDSTTSVEDVPLTVDGGYSGTVRDTVPAITVVDRALPRRADSPEGAELTDCLARLPAGTYTDPDLWIPVGKHDGGGTAPDVLVARIGDIAVGYCIDDPAGGPTFTGAPLPAPSARPQRILVYRGGASALLITAPPGVTRVEVRSATGPGDPRECTILDGLAICAINDDGSLVDADGQDIVVTAFTTTDPQGIVM